MRGTWFSATLLVFACLTCACTSGPETLTLRYSQRQQGIVAAPSARALTSDVEIVEPGQYPSGPNAPVELGLTPIPSDAVSVPVTAVSVCEHPSDNMSFLEETSVAVLRIDPGHEVPGSPRTRRIRLSYWCSSTDTGILRVGDRRVVWFTKSGDFVCVARQGPSK